MDVLKVAALLLLLFEELGTSSSNNYEVPNMALKGFTYWSTTLGNKYQCESLCWKSVSCRSVNFNTRNGTCELSYKGNETKDELTPEEGTLYIIPNDQKNTQPCPCRGRPCKENELCILVDAMMNHLCLPIDIPCQSPEPIPNTNIDVQDTSYKAKAVYNCDAGFEGVGDLEIECRFPGKWSTPSKQCKLVNCSQPKPNPNAEVTLREPGNTTYGARANQTCLTGFTMENGTLDVTCQADGNWSKPTGYCKVVNCSQPKPNPNAEVTLREPGNTTYGARANQTCLTGFTMENGTLDVTCQADGNWSKPTGYCKAIECDDPIPMLYATVHLKYPGNRTYTTMANHTCDPGFEAQGGSMTMTCQSDGQWSGTDGHCEPVDCGQPRVIPHGRPTLTVEDNTAYMATARVICDTHYQPSTGEYTIWCMETGKWSDARCIHKCLSHTGYKFNENPTLCYDVKNDQYNWIKAQEVCQKDGGDLIKLNTTDRTNFMKSVLDLDFPSTPFWIGGKNSSSGWLWVDGTAIVITLWQPDQPSGDGDCVEFVTGGQLFNDRTCDHTLWSICEIVV